MIFLTEIGFLMNSKHTLLKRNIAKRRQMAGESGSVTKPDGNGDPEDKFVAMVSAAVEVDLPLGRFSNRGSSLKTAVHPRSISALSGDRLSQSSGFAEACDLPEDHGRLRRRVSRNITMQVGREALDGMDRLHAAAPDRFSTIGWMDWSGVEQADFGKVSCERLERMVEHGACGIKFWKDLGLSVREAEWRDTADR